MACPEHIGLIDPQFCTSDQDPVTSFMRPAPIPNEDESELDETNSVIDPLDEGEARVSCEYRSNTLTIL